MEGSLPPCTNILEIMRSRVSQGKCVIEAIRRKALSTLASLSHLPQRPLPVCAFQFSSPLLPPLESIWPLLLRPYPDLHRRLLCLSKWNRPRKCISWLMRVIKGSKRWFGPSLLPINGKSLTFMEISKMGPSFLCLLKSKINLYTLQCHFLTVWTSYLHLNLSNCSTLSQTRHTQYLNISLRDFQAM